MKPQINLRLPESLKKAAEKYAKIHRFRNLQEFATEAIREKIMERNYDEGFTPKEIGLIDKLIEVSVLKRKLRTEKELTKALK